MIDQHSGEITSILFMAIAISMDVFSISIGLGMQQLRLKRRLLISLVFGLFHMIIPLLGMLTGKILSNRIGHYTTLAGGLLLFSIGVLMILNTFQAEANNHHFKSSGLGLVLLAFSVSMDSFPVGLSLGLSDVQIVFVLLLFGFISTWLTWIALFIGENIHGVVGSYSELLGGSILVAFGLKIIFMS